MRRLTEVSSRRRTAGFVVVLSAVLAAGVVWAAQGRGLKVTVNYTGSGDVSADNAIYVSVWDTPNLQGGAFPIAQQTVVKNGDSVSFENLTASTVYLAALYDTTGGWDAMSVPPSGTVASVYDADAVGSPGAIEVGDGQAVELDFTFDDAFRMP